MAKTRSQYIKEQGGDEYSFSLVDKATVQKLQRDGKINLPSKKVNVDKDERWNEKQMYSQLMQSITNGDSVLTLANNLLSVVGNNETSAMRNARTMMTSAENAGRLDSYKDLDEQGVVQKKVWIATGDDHTRDSHLMLDGEEVDIDEKFSNGCEFPADPSGDPEEVWNCRCTMRTHIVGFRDEDGSIDYVQYEHESGIHQQEIEEERERRERRESSEQTTNIFGEAIEFSNTILEKHPETKELIESLASKYDTKLKEVKIGVSQHTKGGGSVQVSGTVMEINNFKDASTTIHEFAHSISIENQTKLGLYDESAFWKDIKKVQREYKKDVGNDSSRWISSYEHSHKGSDEFLAEAFTQATMHDMGLDLPSKYGNDFTYSNQVLEIVKKYYGK